MLDEFYDVAGWDESGKPMAEKLKSLICDIELWASELHNKRIPELDDARTTFLKQRAVNRL